MPQYGLQALAFAIVLVIVWYQLAVRDDVSQALPVIALYALAGSRLMPALQKIYQALSQLRYAKPALDALHRDLTEPQMRGGNAPKQDSAKPLGLKNRLEIRAVSYRYPGSATQALHGVSLSIPARAGGWPRRPDRRRQNDVGRRDPRPARTGGGTNCRWTAFRSPTPTGAPGRSTIGYVPQQIFLADDTVAANIAFGVAPGDIDMAEVERAARIANLHDFVAGELEQGYDTLIGERGIRLSGGQRQRVGIARALYRDPDLLIMDEGTSALDNITERAVMEAVNNLARAKTIILIAHRLTTVRTCDRIFLTGAWSSVGKRDL